MRVLVTALIGLAAAGSLEAARLYAAPAMLLVTGTCAYLFALLARDRDAGPRRQLKNTDSVVLKLLLATARLRGHWTGAAALGRTSADGHPPVRSCCYRVAGVCQRGGGVHTVWPAGCGT